MSSKNGFSVDVKVNRSHKYKVCDNGYNYVPLANKSRYSVILRNDNVTRCDVELFIDNIKMGKWRIEPYSTIELNRPANTDNQFYFVSEHGVDAELGCVRPGSHSNGLVTAKFYPEMYVNSPNVVDDGHIQFNSAIPHVNGLEFNAPTRVQSNCYGAQCFRAALGSRASVMNEHVAPPGGSYNFSSGATVLKGKSNQKFGRLPPLAIIDSLRVTEISLRLVVENTPFDDTVYPLTHGSARSRIPPRVDGRYMYRLPSSGMAWYGRADPDDQYIFARF